MQPAKAMGVIMLVITCSVSCTATQHGGYSNAFTEAEATVFYFEADAV